MLSKNLHKFILFLFFGLFSINVFSQRHPVPQNSVPTGATLKAGSFIDVNSAGYPESNYTIEQLIKDVLIKGGTNCSNVNVSNVTVSPNLAASSADRTWGYFNKGTTNFPFAKGIVLVTGKANKTGNSYISATLSDGFASTGDTDLAQALGVSAGQLEDNTFIEFDFVPQSDKVTFRYLLASEEYASNYPCTYTDGFALLLKKSTDPTYTNLAVLPAGGGAVSVTNIHPTIPTANGLSGCAAVNAQYFGGYNSNNIETNFSGRTIPLTATATVTPGATYHFKLVLADFSDPQFDTAVFLEAGSFDLGVQMVDSTGAQLPSTINVCDNQPTVLSVSTSSTTVTYQWLLGGAIIPGATNSSYTATQPGIYTVQVFPAGNSCPSTATVTIVGGTSPVVQNSSLTVCGTGGTTGTFNLTQAQPNISTTAGATFAYYPTLAGAQAANNTNIGTPNTFTGTNGQVIYVLVKNGFCSKIAELTLNIAAQAVPNIALPTVLTCTASQTTLNATASTVPTGATIAWTTAGGNIVSGGNTLSPVINAPGTYTLTITNTYQPGNVICSATASVTVTGNSAPPNTNLTSTSVSICNGESVTLTASGGATYTWGNGLTGTGATQTVSPTTTTIYTVTATGSNGCVSPTAATITITVSQPITAQNGSLSKCYVNGGTAFDLTLAQPQLTSDTGVNFAYYDNLADANLGNGNTIPTNYTVNATQTVYVLITRGGCKKVVSLVLNVSPVVILTIAPPQTINCTTTQITLNASASTIPTGATIAWTTAGGNIVSGATTLNPVVNQGGTYTLTITNASQPGNLNCSYTSSVTVVKDTTAPVATIASTANQICPGESVTLTASGGVSYNWGNGLTGNGATQTVSPTNTTTYTVTAVGANGCVSLPVTITVVVGPPIAALTATKFKICKGESVTLTASGGITYQWDNGITGNGPVQIVTPSVTTTYNVIALGGNGCTNNTPATVTIQVVPEISSILHDVYVCAGDYGVLDAGSQPGYTYQWSNGATTSSISVNVPGTYTVVINNGTCTKSYSAKLINPALPKIEDVSYEFSTKLLTIKASTTSNGALLYSIDNGITWQNSNVFSNVLANSNYSIRVKLQDANCSSSVDYFTFVMINFITPNGDGRNEKIDFSGISKYPNFSASIYDRYGSEVFRATPSVPYWNGTINGYQLPTTSYWYKVHWQNPASKKLEERSGWVVVKNKN